MLKTLKFRRLLGFGNSFVNRLKLSLKKPLRKKILLASTIIFAHTTLIFGQTIFFDEPKEEIDEEIKKKNELKKKIESLSRLVKVELKIFYLIN